MPTQLEIFRVLAPKFSSLSDADVQTLLDLASLEVGEVFGDLRDKAVAYLAAHQKALADRGATSGTVTMEKEGQLQRSYAAPSQGGDGYEATSYGTEFLRIRGLVVFTPMIADDPTC